MATDLPFDPDQTPDPNFVVPDIVGTVEGWRSWRVKGDVPKFGETPKLHSINHGDYIWLPRKESRAKCRSCGDEIPGERHTCGFYSAKTRKHLLSMGYQAYDGERGGFYCVIGRVANWGKVIEGSQGWRAEKSYPVELFVPFEIWKLAKPLSETYGIPVKLDNFLKIERKPE